MKKLLHIGLLLCIAATVTAQENRKLLKVYDWNDLPKHYPNSQIISMDGMSILKIENTNHVSLDIKLLTITNSSLIAKAGLIQYEMKYENVVAKHTTNGSIVSEYWCDFMMFQHFPPQILGGETSTNEQGISLRGSENWTRHDLNPGGSNGQPQPTELDFKVSLPSTGTVYLRPIKVFGHYKTAEGWWSPEAGSWIGGIGGSAIGCFGGLLGWLGGRGKARRFVLAGFKCAIAFGIICSIATVIAFATKQSFYIWQPLLIFGTICTSVFGAILPSAQKRYDELEIRRMTSIDTMGS
jgi:hypothetical protein